MTYPAQEIARAFCKLNPEFSVQPNINNPENKNYVEVRREDGASVDFYHDSYRKKVRCSGNYPDNADGKTMSAREWGVIGYNDEPPSAQVGDSRDPEKAAKDLTRRVLGEYLPLFNECAEKLAAQKVNFADTETRARDILSVLGERDHEPEMDYGTVRQTLYSLPGSLYGDIYVGGDVNLNLRGLTDDQAKRVLAIAMEPRDAD